MDKAANVRNMSVIAHGQYHIPFAPESRLTTVQSITESPPLPIRSSNAQVSFLQQRLVKPDSPTPVPMNRNVV
jgi:hypothetical protein